MNAAASATTTSRRVTTANVMGSLGFTLYNRLLQDACHDDGADQPQAETDEDHPQALDDDETLNTAGLGAERNANADFVRALRHHVRHDAVQTHGRQDQSQTRERPEDEHREPVARQRAGDNLLHRPRLRYGLPVVDRSDFLAHRPGKMHRVRRARSSTFIVGPGFCANGSYTCGGVGVLRLSCLMSPTIPTISRMYVGPAMSSRLPIGSSSGKKRRAIVSLMSTTGGLVAVSCSVINRPRINGICITRRYAGVTWK